MSKTLHAVLAATLEAQRAAAKLKVPRDKARILRALLKVELELDAAARRAVRRERKVKKRLAASTASG